MEMRAVSSPFGLKSVQQTVSVPKQKSLISTINKLKFQLQERSQKAEREQHLLLYCTAAHWAVFQ